MDSMTISSVVWLFGFPLLFKAAQLEVRSLDMHRILAHSFIEVLVVSFYNALSPLVERCRNLL